MLATKKITFLLLPICCFSFLGCVNKHFIREPNQSLVTGVKVKNDIKVALIGFYPYHYSSYTSGRVTTTTALLDYKNSSKQFATIGQPVESFPVNGINTAVSSEKVKQFVMSYLGEVKESGFTEISKVVDIKKEGQESKMHLKKRDVNYYVVGIHGPAFPGFNIGILGRVLLTAHLGILSLGTIPTWSARPTNSKFYIYDSELNLITIKEYKNTYEVIAGWWGDDKQGVSSQELPREFTPKLYEPDVIDFSAEFPALIQKP